MVGGIDRDPAKVGRDLGEVIGLDHPLGAPISDDADLILDQTRPDVVILATTSLFHEVYPQILHAFGRAPTSFQLAKNWSTRMRSHPRHPPRSIDWRS